MDFVDHNGAGPQESTRVLKIAIGMQKLVLPKTGRDAIGRQPGAGREDIGRFRLETNAVEQDRVDPNVTVDIRLRIIEIIRKRNPHIVRRNHISRRIFERYKLGIERARAQASVTPDNRSIHFEINHLLPRNSRSKYLNRCEQRSRLESLAVKFKRWGTTCVGVRFAES